jgi:group II intron reverse transcriptase/maturase
MPGKEQVREMRNAETVLGIVRDRGSRGLPLEDVYRQLYNPELYLLAYGKISKNRGALTPGATDETADGMTLAKIERITTLLRQEKYRWSPARRTYIEKKHSTKTRPLGIPTWSDKLLQEVIRLILEAYYEPQFSPRSHGFRPGRGCHTALREINRTWTGTVWFIEGDIKGCFDNIDHEVLLNTLRKSIHDNRFIRLVENLLKAGYLEEWRHNRTLSGTPQGGVVSPILSNIYLDRLDTFVGNVLIPVYTRGTHRKENPEYRKILKHTRRAETKAPEEIRKLRKDLQRMPSKLTDDPDYRRLRYVRYADDFLLGFTGPRTEAEEIKRQIGEFLHEHLKLELSEEKTLITHGRTNAASYLGYEVTVMHDDSRRSQRIGAKTPRRAITGNIGLKIPLTVVRENCRAYMTGDKPIHRPEQLNNEAFTIVAMYEAKYRGIADYYRMAYNLHRLTRLKWTMETSLTKTLAHKLRISVREVYRRYRTTIQTERGPRVALQVTDSRDRMKPLVATWGKTNLVRDTNAVLNDDPERISYKQTELVERLRANVCELCGSTDNVQVHHVKALRNLKRPGRRERPEWERVMIMRQRKTLVVCHVCHTKIHAGRLNQQREHDHRKPESRVT